MLAKSLAVKGFTGKMQVTSRPVHRNKIENKSERNVNKGKENEKNMKRMKDWVE